MANFQYIILVDPYPCNVIFATTKLILKYFTCCSIFQNRTCNKVKISLIYTVLSCYSTDIVYIFLYGQTCVCSHHPSSAYLSLKLFLPTLRKFKRQFKFNELNSRAASNFGLMWIKCSLFFLCFLSSRIIGLFLLHSCLRVPWPQESPIRLPSYSKFLITVVASPTQALQISCKPFLPEVLHFSKHPISTAVACRWPYEVNLYASSSFRHWPHWMSSLCWIKLTTCEASFWVGCTAIQESYFGKSHGSATQFTMNL